MNVAKVDLRRLRKLLLWLLVLAFCLYLPTLFHEIFSDDEIYMAYSNRFLRQSSWTDLHLLLVKPANPWEFLPLRDFSYWLDFRVWGDEPRGFHATNLLWYAASAVACHALLRQLILLAHPEWSAKCGVLALCGTLLFVVHPAHVEVAAWIASRKDLIAATLGLAALAVLARALRCGWRWPGLSLAALLFFAACFGKAAAMTGIVPISVLLGAAWRIPPRAGLRRKLLVLGLFWALFAVVFAVHYAVGGDTGIRVENHPGAWLTLDRASRIFTTLLGIMLFPHPLRFYYDVYQLADWHWLVSAGALLLLLAALRELSRRFSLWAFGVVLSFSPLFIYLQLTPFATWSLASERFVFGAIAGLALILVELLGRIDRPGRVLVLMLALFVPSAVAVWLRVGDWGEPPVTLLSREYALQPGYHHAIRDRIGLLLLPEKRYGEALALARLLPRSYVADGWIALINAEQARRRIVEARQGRAHDDEAIVSLRRDFCAAIEPLRLANRTGQQRIASEADVSYSNMIRALDRSLKDYAADATLACPVASVE